jgi:hypothetical protein
MAATVEKVAAQALGLPTAGRVLLVEKLLDSLAGDANPAVERVHLEQVRQRRAAARSGHTKLIDGPEALRRAGIALRNPSALGAEELPVIQGPPDRVRF